MRRVQIFIDKSTTICYFHGWGQTYTEFESGPGNYTVGIVEDVNGKIHLINPEDIKFIDKPIMVNEELE